MANQDDETRDLAEALAEALAARGVPAGAHLLEIRQVRAALRDADDLLRRIEEAIVKDARERPPDA